MPSWGFLQKRTSILQSSVPLLDLANRTARAEFSNGLGRFWHLARSMDHAQEMQTGSLYHHPASVSNTKSWLPCFRGSIITLRTMFIKIDRYLRTCVL
jgi:hypothetical protein